VIIAPCEISKLPIGASELWTPSFKACGRRFERRRPRNTPPRRKRSSHPTGFAESPPTLLALSHEVLPFLEGQKCLGVKLSQPLGTVLDPNRRGQRFPRHRLAAGGPFKPHAGDDQCRRGRKSAYLRILQPVGGKCQLLQLCSIRVLNGRGSMPVFNVPVIANIAGSDPLSRQPGG
jgi:hypothetical protein